METLVENPHKCDDPIILQQREWMDKYRTDLEFRDFIKFLENREVALTLQRREIFRSLQGHFVWEDGMLYKLTEDQRKDTIRRRIVVPFDFRGRVLREYHDSPGGGHRGEKAMREVIARTYCWQGMTRDVGRYVAGCGLCRQVKLGKVQKAVTGRFDFLPAK